uniref:Uncharacterized protein n=1 Tax=Anguilla anguilla TaxID=7936 RepID=A0A0E9QTN5_ANGAN
MVSRFKLAAEWIWLERPSLRPSLAAWRPHNWSLVS